MPTRQAKAPTTINILPKNMRANSLIFWPLVILQLVLRDSIGL
jgi:hypothetical protein